MDIIGLLRFAVEHQASDLHLSAGVKPTMRVYGDLKVLDYPTLSSDLVENLMSQVLSADEYSKWKNSEEVDFSFPVAGIGRFRINAYWQERGPAAAFRHIPPSIKTLDDILSPPCFRDIINQPNGLVLVTGATGSGKSTTLAAMIDYINKHKPQHIITIEDPIEFVHVSQKALINQREIGRHTQSFKNALRAALREDPDIILVGEMRDLETIRLALTAAETGHLVFATVHTASAPQTIDRIIDVFPGDEKTMVRTMLAESLRAVISQTLVKSVDGRRIAAFEVMVGTPAIRNLIREDKIAQMVSSMQTGAQYGMQTMAQALEKLMESGFVESLPRLGIVR